MAKLISCSRKEGQDWPASPPRKEIGELAKKSRNWWDLHQPSNGSGAVRSRSDRPAAASEDGRDCMSITETLEEPPPRSSRGGSEAATGSPRILCFATS